MSDTPIVKRFLSEMEESVPEGDRSGFYQDIPGFTPKIIDLARSLERLLCEAERLIFRAVKHSDLPPYSAEIVEAQHWLAALQELRK